MTLDVARLNRVEDLETSMTVDDEDGAAAAQAKAGRTPAMERAAAVTLARVDAAGASFVAGASCAAKAVGDARLLSIFAPL